MLPKLRETQMEELFTKIELPLCAVLAKMENEGFLADAEALRAFGESLTGSIDALREAVWAEAGEEFNIQSPKQLGAVLFEKLGLPGGKKTKTGWSTNADVLDKLRYEPIVRHVLEYRELTKLKSTYADGLLKVIGADGRIHTNFQMTVTATGRLSSTEPNLQNIPVRRELGAGTAQNVCRRARQRARGRGLFADRAAPARAHLGRRGDARGVSLRRGCPPRHGLTGIRRAA